jgi:iron complex outermembrane receptor protein
MNDLYWVPGGNPDLKSESGVSGEAGITYKKQIGSHWDLESKQSVFSNRIHNWILWTPGYSYWTPENIQQVYSRGWEHQLTLSWQRTNIRITVNSAFQQVRSQPISPSSSTNIAGRLQLMYTPEFGWNHHIAFYYKRSKVELNGTYTGKRFVSGDNSSSLPGFYVLNATLEHHFYTKEQVFVMFLQLNNLLNRDYQVLQQRPMPLINMLIGLSISLPN